MQIKNIFKVSQSDRNKFCSNIIDSSAPKVDFYFLVILSSLIVALGLLANNVILVIGGMMVAPLLSPVLAIALGIVINNPKLIIRSLRILLTSFVFAFLIAFILGVFNLVDVSKIGLIEIMKPSLLVFFIATVAGLAASYTWVKPNLNDNLPGVAVTVTLIPPLVAVGLAIASRNWFVFRNVFEVLLLNILGIVMACLVVFSLMDFYRARKKVDEEINEEQKEFAKEKKEEEKNKEKRKK